MNELRKKHLQSCRQYCFAGMPPKGIPFTTVPELRLHHEVVAGAEPFDVQQIVKGCRGSGMARTYYTQLLVL